MDELPRREAGTHLPAEAYRAVGVAKVPNVDLDRFHVDEKTLMVIINGREAEYSGEPWREVAAVCKIPGYSGPGQERALYVRAAALGRQGRGSTKPASPDEKQSRSPRA